MSEHGLGSGAARAYEAVLDLVSLSTAPHDDHASAIDALLQRCQAYFDLPLAMVARISGERCVVEHVIDKKAGYTPGKTYALLNSYCEKVVATGETVMIDDAGQTEFANNPGYEPNDEDTYIGACLRLGDRIYGTLNLAAAEPRPSRFERTDAQVLETAAALIAFHLRAHADQERFDLAMKGSQLGLWQWNAETDELTVSPELHNITGEIGLGEKWGMEKFLDAVHPDDRDRVQKSVEGAMLKHEPYDVEFRFRHGKGGHIWVRSRGLASWDREGMPVQVAGSLEDISQR
ncbi:PAS domain-containing protein, partial [Maricaulis sp. CAU 1757]